MGQSICSRSQPRLSLVQTAESIMYCASRARTYFVGGRIGIGGTEGMKCSEIALASWADRVDKLEVLSWGYACGVLDRYQLCDPSSGSLKSIMMKLDERGKPTHRPRLCLSTLPCPLVPTGPNRPLRVLHLRPLLFRQSLPAHSRWLAVLRHTRWRSGEVRVIVVRPAGSVWLARDQ